jgi:hypothetical protein
MPSFRNELVWSDHRAYAEHLAGSTIGDDAVTLLDMVSESPYLLYARFVPVLMLGN